ncbi:MAG: type II secretion system F family protein [candidate division Zixibacteria bacterium]|nr:type II secretion system F family protein [candidate division Zixibacteria bacterium]
MPAQYKYRAVTVDGRFRNGVITAQGSDEVEDFLQAQRLIPVSVSRLSDRRPITLFGFLKGDDYERLIQFVSSLATMYRAGIPLLRALTIIKDSKDDPRFTFVIDQVMMSVQAGRPLSSALAEFPEIFSDVFVACVAAGEESGKLDETLDELGAMLERELELTRNIRSAVRYPLIVVGVMTLAVTILMTFVIPRFVSFYSSFGAELPLPTRIIIETSNFLVSYWWAAIICMAGIGYGIRAFLNRPGGRRWLDAKLLQLPVFGSLLIRGNTARFSMMLRIMYKSGLPLIRSMEILTATIKNTVYSGEIQKLAEIFHKGMSVNQLDGAFRYFPAQALHMIAIGLESGNLEHMLRQIGDHYSKQVLYTSRHLTAIIEPILTLVLGSFVLLLALAIFLPMWNLIKVFNH